MSNPSMRILCFAIFFIWAIKTMRFTTWASTTPSIYEALESHGLPMGLLPKGVQNYTLSEDGKFQVHLDQACNAKFESELHYEKDVSGQLSFGQIRNLSGMSAQDLFLWFPVKGIRVDIPSSGIIYFDVGVVFKQFPLSLFETPPDCVAASQPLDLLRHRSFAVDGLFKIIYDVEELLTRYLYGLKLNGNLRYHFDEGKNARAVM